MSTHRIRDVEYDEDDLYDDDYDDYDEGAHGNEGVSAEDDARLKSATAAVSDALKGELDLRHSELEETVWHYYFDVDKSISYLRSKHAPKGPKKQKQAPPSKFDMAVQTAETKGEPPLLLHLSPLPSKDLFWATIASTADWTTPGLVQYCGTMTDQVRRKDHFIGIPWLHVPAERQGIITPLRLAPRGGLLGGSGKPSKLAALAAARKKAQAERTSGDENQKREAERESSASISLLDRLSLQSKPGDRSSSASAAGDKRPSPLSEGPPPPRKYPRPKKPGNDLPSTVPPQQSSQDAITSADPESDARPLIEDIRTTPSTFALTMFGASSSAQPSATPFTFPSSPAPADPFSSPSPDDIVLSAQSQGKTTPSSKPPTSSLKDLSISDKPPPAPKVKSKNIDVPKAYLDSSPKNAANFVVIGHVDHGKSTLMGRLLYDLRVFSERDYSRLSAAAAEANKASFSFAWVMDSTAEERARGVTVDIATNHFETAQTRFTILDAPGHRDFIPNMIAGAAQADFAVLVVDASTNAFEAGLRGQTREHALLARSLGISRVIVAVNKMDAAAWSEDRFTQISQQMHAFLVSARFPETGIVFVPCAGLTGENITAPAPSEKAPWYSGPTLVAALDASEPSTRALNDPLRMTVNDVFSRPHVTGVSISGRIESGSMQLGQPLLAQPAGETTSIRSIEVDDASAEWAVAGQIVTLALDDIDPVHLRPGDILCSPTESPVKNVRAFTAKILAFEHVFPGPVELHKGRMHSPANVTHLTSVLNKATGAVEKKKPKVLKPGMLARVRVEITGGEGKGVPLEEKTRVVLRSEGGTVAAGLIEGVEEWVRNAEG